MQAANVSTPHRGRKHGHADIILNDDSYSKLPTTQFDIKLRLGLHPTNVIASDKMQEKEVAEHKW